VYRSKHIVDHLNPFWDHFSFSLEELCYCDPSWPLRLTVWDHEENGKHKLIGEIETTLELLTERVAIKGNADRDRALEIVSDSKSAPGVKKTRGLIVVLQASFNRDENNRDPPGRAYVYNGR
jgi:Ca2+-dependent lipid-binding protein